jgi:hypothetical protein
VVKYADTSLVKTRKGEVRLLEAPHVPVPWPTYRLSEH